MHIFSQYVLSEIQWHTLATGMVQISLQSTSWWLPKRWKPIPPSVAQTSNNIHGNIGFPSAAAGSTNVHTRICHRQGNSLMKPAPVPNPQPGDSQECTTTQENHRYSIQTTEVTYKTLADDAEQATGGQQTLTTGELTQDGHRLIGTGYGVVLFWRALPAPTCQGGWKTFLRLRGNVEDSLK